MKAMRQLNFIGIDLPSTYNGFLGRPFEHEFGVVTLVHYYFIKFPIQGGAVGTVRGNQAMLRECMLQTDMDLNLIYLSCGTSLLLVVLQDHVNDQTLLPENEPNKKIRTNHVEENDPNRPEKAQPQQEAGQVTTPIELLDLEGWDTNQLMTRGG